MILWFWASFPTMMRPHTWMRWRDLHHGARTTVSLWTWAKLKSWLWTSERDTCCPTLLCDQRDPCGESKQLQVPRCKHLRGPDLDYTHPNTGQESQAKTVPSATAEEIQGLTNNPENFLCRDHRKCIDSVLLSVVWKQLQPRLQSLAESCALSWAYLWVCSPLSAGHLPQTLQKQSCQNHQGRKSPWKLPIHSAAIW